MCFLTGNGALHIIESFGRVTTYPTALIIVWFSDHCPAGSDIFPINNQLTPVNDRTSLRMNTKPIQNCFHLWLDVRFIQKFESSGRILLIVINILRR